MNAIQGSSPTLPAASIPDWAVIYDGNCNLCNFWVGKILKYRPGPPFQLISLHSQLGAQLYSSFATAPEDISSMLYFRNGRIFEKSDAVIQIGKDLEGGWRLLILMKWFPKGIRDALYSIIATHRYRVFGKYTGCSTKDCGSVLSEAHTKKS